MSVQTDNERTINLLWAIGDEMFDGMLAQITKQVEIAEKPEEECELCGGTGEYTLGRSDSDWGEIVKCECAK